jgi:4-amino-4-deoxy-L-arabinose transferase-like glycosyltransferase
MTRETAYKYLSAILFAILLAFIFLTWRDYGISWDEFPQDTYGEYVVRYYTSFFKDLAAVRFVDLCYYGGFFEGLLKVGSRVLPFGTYETRHLITALFGMLGVLGCWKVGKVLSGNGAAFFGALLLVLYPPYYGHMFINSKDIPFAVFYVWALYYLLRLVDEFPKVSFWAAIRFGIAAGLTMAVRVGGLLLLCYFVLTLAILLGSVYFRRNSQRVPSGKLLLAGAVATILAYGIMLIFWPFAIREPFVAPFAALAWFSREAAPSFTRSHLPLHLVFKLPELYLLLLLAGLYLAIRAVYTRKASIDLRKTLSYVVIMFAVLFPVVYAIATRPILYDEIRHFLFIVPPLLSLLGVALYETVESAFRKAHNVGFIVILLLGSYFALQVWLMTQLHPYEYAYYNRFLGGVRGAHEKGYDTEYWATSYKRGVEMLKDYLQHRDGASFASTRYTILLGDAEWCATPYFPENFVQVTSADQADFYLTTTRYEKQKAQAGPQIVEVQRFGVPFLIGKIVEHEPRPGELEVSRTEITLGESYVLRVPSAPRSQVVFRYSLNGKTDEEFTATLDDRGEIRFDVSDSTPRGLYRFTFFRKTDKPEWTPAGATINVK